MTMPTWISEFQAFSTVIIAGSVAAAAIQQYRIAARKLKLDLYQRRYEIFDAMRNLITANFKDDQKEVEIAISLAYQKKAEARFLLDAAACTYLDKFVGEISKYRNVNKDIIKPNVLSSMPKELIRVGNEQSTRLMWMYDQYEPLVQEFQRFLVLDHALGLKWRSWFSRLKA